MNTKKGACVMLIVMTLMFFLTLSNQCAADEGDTGGDCEILRQVPQMICLTVEDGDPAEESSE